MTLSTLGCLRDWVPKTLAHISSLLLSKKTGLLTTARIWSEILEHLMAIFSFPSSFCFYSEVTGWVIGTLRRCLSPWLSVKVFMCITSRSSISFMNLFRGKAQPSPMVYRYSACSTSMSRTSRVSNSLFSSMVTSLTRDGDTLWAEKSVMISSPVILSRTCWTH